MNSFHHNPRSSGIGAWLDRLTRRLAQRLLNLSSLPDDPAALGFRVTSAAQTRRAQMVIRAFRTGCETALDCTDVNELGRLLHAFDAWGRGFAFEGAGMTLALLDRLSLGSPQRFDQFLHGPGARFTYLIHVGAGWVLARMPGRVPRFLERLDPVLGWLAVDGYGFHHAFFRTDATVRQQAVPGRIHGYARRVFDQGIGRCLWFVEGAEVGAVVQTISTFAPARRADLWSGVGLAALYAGEAAPDDLTRLVEIAGPFRSPLAQGAAFAAKARELGGNPTPYQDLACEILCGLPAREAARVTDDALENLPIDASIPAYEVWRQRIQQTLQPASAAVSP